MPPPAVPFEAPQGEDWLEIERKIGTALPCDYKRFIESYGSGRIDDFLSILNPFSANKYLNLFFQFETQLASLSELKATGSEIVPFDLFPMPGGLLPFGITDNGDVLYWVTVGQPDVWTVAINASRSPDWRYFAVGMVAFLWKTLTRQELCEVFPDDFPSDTPLFFQTIRINGSQNDP